MEKLIQNLQHQTKKTSTQSSGGSAVASEALMSSFVSSRGRFFICLLAFLLGQRSDGFIVPIRRTTTTFRLHAVVVAAEESTDDRYYESFQDEHERTARITLTRYLDDVVKEQPELANLRSLVLALRMACKSISNLVNRANLASSDDAFPFNDLDQLSTLVLKNSLRYTGKCRVTALHEPDILVAESLDSSYVACLDPLDGSSNASICTGTIFGIFTADDCEPMQAVLQPAKNMKAAGYCLYSSATVLVLTLNDSVQAFTLDLQSNEFVLMKSNLRIPQRGHTYSCNEANSLGWEDPVQKYIHALKAGACESKQRYNLRYVGSMIGDVHRTLLNGGIFLYPSDNHDHPSGNLGYYKTSPVAVICERAGGRSTNGTVSLLEVDASEVRQKSPCFLGSPDDVAELESYLVDDTTS